MAVYALRKGQESNDSLFQRWKKQVQQTGILKTLRERSTRKRTPSKRLQRVRALKREDHRTQNRQRQFYSNM